MTSQSILSYIADRPHAKQMLWLNGNGRLVGDFMDCHITSEFQAIWQLDGSAIEGREAFVRTHTDQGRGVSVWELFDQAADDEGIVFLDRLCRTLHAMNFFLREHFEERLFLNVHERLLHHVPEEHGYTFAKVLHSLGIPANRVVMELPERISHSRSMLKLLVQNYRRHGFGVAVNVSSLEEAWELAAFTGADVIKLPAPPPALIGPARQEIIQRFVKSQHKLVFTKVELPEQAAVLRAAGAPLAQGHWLEVAYGTGSVKKMNAACG